MLLMLDYKYLLKYEKLCVVFNNYRFLFSYCDLAYSILQNTSECQDTFTLSF